MRGHVRWCGTATALLFAFGLLVVAPGAAQAQGWSDDFEAYSAGDAIGPQSPNWTAWDDAAAAEGFVSDAQSNSGDQSLELPTGSDLVALLSGVDDGAWSIAIQYYVPDTSVLGESWLGIFDTYSNGGAKSQGYGLTFNLVTGQATDGGGVVFDIVRNAWVELKFDIDLTTNTMDVSYDGVVVKSQRSPVHARTQIQGLDFWSNNADPVFIDDVVITQLPDPTCDDGMKLVQLGNHDAYQPLPDPAWAPSTAADNGCEPGVVVNGTGGDIWGGVDSAHYLYHCDDKLQGNFDASVLIQSFENPVDGANAGEWARAGFMVRASDDGNSPNQQIGVNMRGMPADPNARKLLHSSRDAVGAGTSDNRQDNFHTPIWVRLRRVGDSFTSYYKYEEGDDWTEFATRTTVMPDELLYGYGLMNHGGNSTKPPFEAVFCHLETVKLADVGVSDIVGLPALGGVALTWVPEGDIARYSITRTDAAGEIVLEAALAGTETSYLDTNPIDGNSATYLITPFDAADETAGGVAFTYSVDLTADNGAITTWILSPHYNQAGSANPPTETMALDYLTDGAGIDESNFIPGPGDTVATDYDVAQSTGCNAGSNPNTSCDPPTYFMYQSGNGVIDFNSIFGDINDVMTYMITYVTNTTDDTLHARFRVKPDDGAQFLLDNTTYYFRAAGCCSFEEFYVAIPPGEHRIMLKVFEGGGGHNGEVHMLDWDTNQPFAAGLAVISPIPTMTEVPEEIPLGENIGMDNNGNVQEWLLSPHLNQAGGANPAHDVMAQDYLTDGAGLDESNIIPEAGLTVATDFAVAASTGCTCGTNATGCGCDPVTFFPYTAANGFVDFNAIFGDINDVMTYMVTYVTNTSDEELVLTASLKPDDSAQVLLGNTTWYYFDGCCAFRDFSLVLPPGEHRLMIKIFEGGGGHNGHLRLFDADGRPLPRGLVEVSSVPTITGLPPAPTVVATRVVPTIPATGSDPVTVTINLEPTDVAVDVYELVPAPWAAPTNISAPGVFDPASETIFWAGVTGSVSYDVVPFTGQPALDGIVDDGTVLAPVIGASTIPYLEVETQLGWFMATIANSGQPMSSEVRENPDDATLVDMTVVGSGPDIWGTADGFRYVWKEIPTDSTHVIQGRLDSFPRNTNDWAKAALMVRANASQGSSHAQAAFRAGVADPADSTGHQMQWREFQDGNSGNQDPLVDAKLPYWIRGVYTNGQYRGYFAPDVDGAPGEWVLREGSPRTIDTLGRDTVLIGVAVTSHDNAVTVTAEWSKISLTEIDLCVPTVELVADSETTFPLDCSGESTLGLTATVGGCPVEDTTITWAIDNGATIVGDGETATATFTAAGSYTATVIASTSVGDVIISATASVAVTVAEPTDCGVLMNPGDLNVDGSLNISDPVAGLNFLFAGIALNACLTEDDGEGGVTLTAFGISLGDWNGDGDFNISDPVGSLNFLFAAGNPHVLGEGCQSIVGDTACESNCVIDG